MNAEAVSEGVDIIKASVCIRPGARQVERGGRCKQAEDGSETGGGRDDEGRTLTPLGRFLGRDRDRMAKVIRLIRDRMREPFLKDRPPQDGQTPMLPGHIYTGGENQVSACWSRVRDSVRVPRLCGGKATLALSKSF